MKYTRDKELAPYFTLNQMLSNSDKQQPDHEQIINLTHLAIKLSELRKVLGRMDITSGFRGKAHNSAIGGDLTSLHPLGLAADFERKNSKGVEDWGKWTAETLFEVANDLGFGNTCVYLSKTTGKILWVHVDIGKPWPNGVAQWKRYSDTMSCRILRR